jgi:hypothetical protein
LEIWRGTAFHEGIQHYVVPALEKGDLLDWNQLEVPETIVELRRVMESLAKGAALDKPAFAALDRVCEAADATASAASRRLRRI